MLLGKTSLPITNQGTLALPEQDRQAFPDVAYLTPGFEKDLLLMPKDVFEKVCRNLQATSLTDPLARLLARLILGNAVEVKLESGGEIPLPPSLCKFAGLKDKAIVIGQGQLLEIWSPAEWDDQAELMLDADENIERFSKLNIILA
jgi:MraZ protein